jgi:hypothetical protein
VSSRPGKPGLPHYVITLTASRKKYGYVVALNRLIFGAIGWLSTAEEGIGDKEAK